MIIIVEYFNRDYPTVLTNEDGTTMFFDAPDKAVMYGTEELHVGCWKVVVL